MFVVAYRSSYGFQEMEVEGSDNAQDQVASITNAGCFLVGITEKEVRKWRELQKAEALARMKLLGHLLGGHQTI